MRRQRPDSSSKADFISGPTDRLSRAKNLLFTARHADGESVWDGFAGWADAIDSEHLRTGSGAAGSGLIYRCRPTTLNGAKMHVTGVVEQTRD